MSNPIYTVTAVGGKQAWDVRTWGWFPTLEEARAAVASDTSAYGMRELVYRWLVIEAVKPGPVGRAQIVAYYDWQEDKADPERGRWAEMPSYPPELERVCNFAMG